MARVFSILANRYIDRQPAFAEIEADARQAQQDAATELGVHPADQSGGSADLRVIKPLIAQLQAVLTRLEHVEKALLAATAAARPAGEPPHYEMVVADRDLNNRPHRILLRPAKATL